MSFEITRDGIVQDVATVQRIDSVPRILEVVCRLTGMGFAAVARVTGERWVACAVKDTINFGLRPGGELKVETTICSAIRDSGEIVVIDHVDQDEIYCVHPTPKLYGFQSYISVPIVLSNGRFFGTLCAIDPLPQPVNKPETIDTFKLFAELIANHLDAIEQLVTSEASLFDERKTAELREQFIAVLGHDLRNPLASIGAGVDRLARTTVDDGAKKIVDRMGASVTRMADLIENILDFARGRLGGGITLRRDQKLELEPVLQQVIDELRQAYPGCSIESEFSLKQPVDCDRRRVAQLFSNLVGNALTHGLQGAPITIRASTGAGQFELSVCNAGNQIPQLAMARLFYPFSRGEAGRNQQGLGLGLYIASEIAKAHGGTLAVDSSPAQTCFTFTMPLR